MTIKKQKPVAENNSIQQNKVKKDNKKVIQKVIRRSHFKMFISSLKCNSVFAYTFAMDFLHYVILLIILFALTRLMLPQIMALSAISGIIQDVSAQNLGEVNARLIPVAAAYHTIIFYFGLGILLFILNWTFFKSWIWCTLEDKDFGVKIYLKSLFYNIFLFSIFAILLVTLLYTMKERVFPIVMDFIIIPLLLFCGIVLHIFLDNKILEAAKRLFVVLGRFYLLIIPLFFSLFMAGLGLVVFGLLFALLSIFISTDTVSTSSISFVFLGIFIVLLYANWLRAYLRIIVHNLTSDIE